jgi:tRNA threonylcarbamoyladenosine biosynthesis protein TsaE
MTDDHQQYRLASEAETLALGAWLAAGLLRPALVFLRGDLGAGKTTLSRGILRALGHAGPVKSPTYTLVEPYEHIASGPVFHFDLYRLGDPEELEYLGMRDYLAGQALVLVEWPERAADWLPEPTADIELRHAGNEREVIIRGDIEGLAQALHDLPTIASGPTIGASRSAS